MAEDLPFVLGLVNPPPERYPAYDAVRDAQRRAAREFVNVHLVETDDLSKRSDNLHYDTAGNLELGRRFAAMYLSLGVKALHARTLDYMPANARLIGDR